MRKLLALTFTLALPPAAPGAQDSGIRQAIEAEALAEMKAMGIPGAAVAVVKGDRPVFATGLGVASAETGGAVTADTLFRLGSTTKMFTAAALVGLSLEGRLDLHQPVGRYIPQLNPRVGEVTAAQLLTHTAGLADEAPMFGLHDESALGEGVRQWTEARFFTAPGRIYSYSNPGYWLAGYLAERIAGKPFATVLEERLFRPLGMSRTTFRPLVAMTWPLAQGHEGGPKRAAGVIRPAADNAGSWPAGSMFSCVNDLARFAIAFLNEGVLEGRRVLPRELIRELFEPRVAIPGSADRYGYGLRSGEFRGVKTVSHGGSRAGYGSFIRFAPAERVAIITLANLTGQQMARTQEKAASLLLPVTAVPQRPAEVLPLSEPEMRRCAGVYGNGEVRRELLLKNGRLYLRQNRREVPVARTGVGRFRTQPPNGGPGAEFVLVEGKDGNIEFLHMGGRAARRQR